MHFSTGETSQNCASDGEMAKYYYTEKNDKTLDGPFSVREALVHLANTVRQFFDLGLPSGFNIPGVYAIYERCTFGVVGLALPPIFKLENNLAMLIGFSKVDDSIKVKYFPVSMPRPEGVVFARPQAYIASCDSLEVEKVDRLPFVHETWFRWKISVEGEVIMPISYNDTMH